ncbi:PilW family protein [Pseudomonas sp. Pseusp122]|uniref:PilW family protein n=1 Tax=unclassified Pseudomonas TaxID=196821 RepID=UPI0039A62D08
MKGFSLVEIMLALALGLILSLGLTRLLMATQSSYLAQDAAMRMQEDARYLLQKLAQEIRMAGMYGCAAFEAAASVPEVFRQPLRWDRQKQTLSMITTDTGNPDWTVVSDCKAAAKLYVGKVTRPEMVNFHLRQLNYRFTGNAIQLEGQGLVQNVKAFSVSFGLAGTPMSYSPDLPVERVADLRSVRLSLTLTDPQQRTADQTWHLAVALRNGWRT